MRRREKTYAFKASRTSKIFTSLLIIFAQILAGLSLQVMVAPSAKAVGTCTSTFASDTLWKPVRNTTGGLLTDPLNDSGGGSGSSNVDIYGTEATSSAPAGSAIDWYSQGTSSCFQFRMRIAATAVTGGKLDNQLWVVGLGTGAITNAWMVVNADPKGTNKVEIYNSTPSVQFTYIFTNAGANNTYAWGTSNGSRHYVYWQVPYADLISVLGSSTIYGFFAGTSQANSFSSINRDCLSAVCTSPSYTETQKVDLSQDVTATINPPVISSLSVTKGTTAGNTSTVISGTNLTNTVRVLFGSTPATIVSFTSETVTVTTPAGSVGDANVQVETAAGGSSNILQDAYKYITAPTATSVAATGLSSTTAQLNGTINAGNDSTATSFCWGTASNLTGCTSVNSDTKSGTSTSAISYSLTGLTNSTTYYYRASGTNSLGTSTGTILSFTTAAAALSITSNTPLTAGQVGVSYTLKLTATGGSGTYSSWAITSGSLPNGLLLGTNGIITGKPTATGTSSNIVIQVADSAGTTASKTFAVTISAGPPIATTLTQSSVTTNAATLNGTVEENGATTTVSWCMSTDAAVNASGQLFSCTQIAVTASPSSISAASGLTAITGSATGLTDLTTYYFQLKASNSAGTSYAEILTFQTNNKSNQSTLTATLSPTSKTYPYSQVLNNSTSGGSTSGTVTYAVVPGGTAQDCLLSDASATATLSASTSGTCLVTATMAGNATYKSVTSASATFTFNKASLTVTADDKSVGYGSAAPTYTYTYSGFVNSENSTSIAFTTGLVNPACTSAYTSSTPIASSPVTITCSGGSATNYTFAYATGQITISTGTQATLSITTLGGTSKIYPYSQVLAATTSGGSGTGAVTYAISSGGSATGCTLSNTSATATLTASTAGTCLIVATKASDGNYNSISSAAATFTFTLGTQSLTIAAGSSTLAYYGTTTITPSGNSGTGTITYTPSTGCSISGTTLTATASSGTCTLTATIAADSNYSSATSNTLTITRTTAPLTITSTTSSASKSYGASNPTFSFTSSGLKNSETISSVTNTFTGTGSYNSSTPPSNVGTYTLTPSAAVFAGGASASNYTITYATAAYEITKANQTLTIAAGSTSIAYYGTTSITASAYSGSGTITYTVGSGCALVSGTLTVTASSGTCTITASIAADSNYNTATSNTLTITRTTAPLTITATTSAASKVYGATDPTFSFTSSGLKNSESISSMTKTFTGTGSYNSTDAPSNVGSYTLTPSAAVFDSGSASNYTITYATVAYSITKATQSVLWSPTTTYQTTDKPVPLSGSTGFGEITYAVTTVGSIHCSIVAGQLTWNDAATGSCVVTASAAGDANHDPGSIAKTFTVTTLTTQTISFTSPGNKTYGDTFTVLATATSGLAVAIATSGGGCTGSGTSNSDSSVTLTASAGGTGNCIITASQSGGGTYAPASDVTRSIDINKASRSITISADPSSITYFGTTTITLSSYSGTGTLTYSVGTGCSLDAGTLTSSTSSGTCDITATLASDDNYLGATSNTLTISRTTAPLTITATRSSASKSYGGSDPTFSFSSGSLKNSESITDVVKTFTGSGEYNSTTPPSNVGTYTITLSGATISGGGATNYTISYVTASYEIVKASQTISFTSPGNKTYGSTFTATATSNSGLTVTITASGDCSGSGDSPVTITPTAVGTGCVLTATQSGNGNYLAASNVVNTISILDRSNPSLALVYPGSNTSTLTVNGTITPSTNTNSGDGAVTYTTSSSSVCSVNSTSGVITMLATGNCAVVMSSAATATYNSASITVTFVITSGALSDQSALVLSVTPTSKTYSYSQILTMSTSGGSIDPGTVTYAIASGGTATGCALSNSSSSATITSSTSGTCFIAATKAGNETYNPVTSSNVIFTFNQATQTVSFTTPSAMTVGDANQALTFSASSGLTVTITSNATSICTISSSSVAAVAAGTCSITASQSGNSNYSAASSITRTFTVTASSAPPSGDSKSDPDLSWSDPADISSGTALSSRQLNASASVPGRYSYSPASGTVLPVGSHSLSL